LGGGDFGGRNENNRINNVSWKKGQQDVLMLLLGKSAGKSSFFVVVCTLLWLHVLSDPIAVTLLPVQLGACHGQLTAQRLEGAFHGRLALLDCPLTASHLFIQF